MAGACHIDERASPHSLHEEVARCGDMRTSGAGRKASLAFLRNRGPTKEV